MFFPPNETDNLLIFGLNMFLSSLFVWVCIMPVIFNVFIIPDIEKRIGKRLVFTSKCYDYPFSKNITKHIEVALYICMKFLGINKEFSRFALSKNNNVNYDIKIATKSEIVLSFIDIVAILFFYIGIIIMIIKIPPSFLSDRSDGVSSNFVSIAPMSILHDNYQASQRHKHN